jgi:hypothetical protein
MPVRTLVLVCSTSGAGRTLSLPHLPQALPNPAVVRLLLRPLLLLKVQLHIPSSIRIRSLRQAVVLMIGIMVHSVAMSCGVIVV